MSNQPIPKPMVTALMLCYGRWKVAAEAVESFLRQTYRRKRLLIVNTHPDPLWFEDEYPTIEVHNIAPDPFENLNQKYNYAFGQIRTPWWCPWDSDDIWLPWHLENLIAGIPGKREHSYPFKVGLQKCYFSNDNTVDRIGWNMWSNCIYETFDAAGNLYPRCDHKIAKNCDGQILYTKWERVWLMTSPKSYIFRWSQDPHGSAYLNEQGLAYQRKCRERMYAVRSREPLKPHWDRDYVKDVQEFNAGLKQGS